MAIPSTDKMPAIDIPQETLPCLILIKTENGRTVEVASAVMCSVTKQPGFVKLILMLRLLWPRIVERYPDGLEFDDVEPLKDREGELFII